MRVRDVPLLALRTCLRGVMEGACVAEEEEQGKAAGKTPLILHIN